MAFRKNNFRKKGQSVFGSVWVAVILALLFIAIVVYFVWNWVGVSGARAILDTECTTSLRSNQGNELWVSPKKTLIDKDKEDQALSCYTHKTVIEAATSKQASGETVTYMKDCFGLYSKYADVFHLAKGSVCLVCERLKFPGISALLELPPLIEKERNKIGGFGPAHYQNVNSEGEIAVIAVYSENFMDDFSLVNSAGVFLWDANDYTSLPCAVLENLDEKPPMKVMKSYALG